MKIIISPSKTQNKSPMPDAIGSDIVDMDQSLKLFEGLKSFSKAELKSLMKIKNQLLDETYHLYQSGIKDLNQKQAIHLYQGIVFNELDLNAYTPSEITYMNEHLVILSAMYGPLKPNAMIWPYRLDMTMKPNHINLYDYWQNIVDAYFGDEIIINLASNEFSKMIKKQKKHMITIDFKEKKNDGSLKTVSIYAKKARGQMLNQIIIQEIEDINEIKKLNIDGYQYQEALSNKKRMVFVR